MRGLLRIWQSIAQGRPTGMQARIMAEWAVSLFNRLVGAHRGAAKGPSLEGAALDDQFQGVLAETRMRVSKIVL